MGKFREFISSSALAFTNSFAGSALLSLLDWGDVKPNYLRVLTYHRVDWPQENPHLYPGVLSASPTEFANQLNALQRRFHLVSLEEVLQASHHQLQLPPRSVLITFDDAYQSFADFAWPELRRRNIPVVLFVPTSFPDHPERTFWWDRIYWSLYSTKVNSLTLDGETIPIGSLESKNRAARRVMTSIKQRPHDEAMTLVEEIGDKLRVESRPNEVISWEHLARLTKEGVTIGAHSHTHPLMNQLPLEVAKEEAETSRAILQDRLGQPIDSFCYPAGGFDDNVVDLIKQLGFQMAFSTYRGINEMASCDRFRMRRINVGIRTSINAMRMQFLPMANHFVQKFT